MAVTKDEVKKLAELARIELTEEEVVKMQGEIEAILAYVATIQKVSLPDVPQSSPYLDIENVMREDGEPHAPGIYTDAIMAQAPKKQGNFIKVKKILG
jgi:aspartyl-tRNA(Asn)/glutamyl-tRNA(Gln) amidotransferase subunit C